MDYLKRFITGAKRQQNILVVLLKKKISTSKMKLKEFFKKKIKNAKFFIQSPR